MEKALPSGAPVHRDLPHVTRQPLAGSSPEHQVRFQPAAVCDLILAL